METSFASANCGEYQARSVLSSGVREAVESQVLNIGLQDQSTPQGSEAIRQGAKMRCLPPGSSDSDDGKSIVCSQV